jgi:hypothetical protein
VFAQQTGQGLEEIVPVNIINKYILLPVATVDDMIDGSWILNSQGSRHGVTFARSSLMSSTVTGRSQNQTFGLTPPLLLVEAAVLLAKSEGLIAA